MDLTAWHREIASGRRRGPVASLARGLLRAASAPYGAVAAKVAREYDAGRRETFAAAVPVISVGNLTAGGTGKTPVTAHFANLLYRLGRRVAIVSRGYKPLPGDPAGRNDEALVLEALASHAVLIINRDRVAGATRAVEDFRADVVLLDDGFQHRRLRRDLDVVLLDATEPFGFDRLLPAGRLREPVTALRRADLAVITRAESVDEGVLADIRRRVAEIAPGLSTAAVAFEPSWASEEKPHGRIGAFCGLGNPDGFLATLQRLGVTPTVFEAFPDHHRYGPADLSRLVVLAERHRLDAWACTRKDAVKLDRTEPPFDRAPLAVVDQSVRFVDGAADTAAMLRFAISESRAHAA
ncbi:MAG: tetraacyldisaccharide 4'-kinase [Planctomycetota bacterium]